MLKINRKGFTLIELLVVIAIIGILASIVMVSLNSARNKAKAAQLKSIISSIGPSVAVCCDTSTNTLLTVADADVCSTSISSLLPTFTQLGLPAAGDVVYAQQHNCSTQYPALSITITNHPVAACNATVWVTTNGIMSGADGADADSIGDTMGFPAGC